MHFFNPVNMMPLVEVIRGKQSSRTPWPRRVKLGKPDGQDAGGRE